MKRELIILLGGKVKILVFGYILFTESYPKPKKVNIFSSLVFT